MKNVIKLLNQSNKIAAELLVKIKLFLKIKLLVEIKLHVETKLFVKITDWY